MVRHVEAAREGMMVSRKELGVLGYQSESPIAETQTISAKVEKK